MEPELNVKVQETKPGSITITIDGRIDSTNYINFEESVKPVMDKNPKTVVLEMAGMDYISSAGLGVIFTMMKNLKDNQGELLLCNLQPQIKKVFEIVKALPPSSIFSSMEEADAYLDHIISQEIEKRQREGEGA